MAQQQQLPIGYQNVSLYVGQLAEDCNEATLFEAFNKPSIGTVVSVKICRDTVTKKSLGYGYVNYQTHAEADSALDILNHTNIATASGARPCRIMWSERDSNLRKNPAGNTFVKGINKDMNEKDLEDIFSYFGQIKSCKIKTDPTNGKSIGHAFVHFADPQDALKAIAAAKSGTITEIPGVTVDEFLPKSSRLAAPQNLTAYCKHYPKEWTERDFFERFESVGMQKADIKEVWIAMNILNSEPLGFAIVTLSDRNAVDRLITCSKANPISYITAKTGTPEEHPVNFYVAEWKRKADREREKKQKVDESRAETKKRKIYVINLEPGVKEVEIFDYFNAFCVEGGITVRLVLKSNTNQAYILYSNQQSAQAAIAAHQREVKIKASDMKPLVVKPFETKEERALKAQTYAKSTNSRGFYNNNARGGFQQQPQMYAGGGSRYPYPAGGYAIPNYSNGPFQQQHYNNRRAVMPGMVRAGPQFNRMPNPHQQRNFNQGGPNNRPMQGGYNNNNMMPRGNQGNYGVNRPQMAMQNAPLPQVMPQAPRPVGFNIDQLHNLPQPEQVNYIGEELYSKIHAKDPHRAGKITGMLLEMDVTELLHLIESPDLLQEKMEEAIKVLEEAK